MDQAKPEQTAMNDSGTAPDSGKFLTPEVPRTFTEFTLADLAKLTAGG